MLSVTYPFSEVDIKAMCDVKPGIPPLTIIDPSSKINSNGLKFGCPVKYFAMYAAPFSPPISSSCPSAKNTVLGGVTLCSISSSIAANWLITLFLLSMASILMDRFGIMIALVKQCCLLLSLYNHQHLTDSPPLPHMKSSIISPENGSLIHLSALIISFCGAGTTSIWAHNIIGGL